MKKKRAWTTVEDEVLRRVMLEDPKKKPSFKAKAARFSEILQKVHGLSEKRNGKQCRERFVNYVFYG